MAFMFKRPNIPFLRIPSNSPSLDIRLFRLLYGFNLVLLLVVSATLLLDSIGIFINNYYPLEMSIMSIAISSLYFLRKGLKKVAVNLINFLPVPIYFLLVSPVMGIFPPQHSYFFHVFLLSFGMLFLLIFADNKNQIFFFIFVSLISLLYHFYITGAIVHVFSLFWSTQEMMFNPFILLFLFASITIFLFYLFHGELQRQKTRMSAMDTNLQNIVYQIPLGIIKIRIERDEMGEKSGLTIDYINPVFENFFELKNSEIKGRNASTVFQKVFKDEVNWQELLLNRGKVKNEIYLPHSKQWYQVIVIHPCPDSILGILENITEVKHTLKELDINTHRYKLLLETIPDIFFVIDKEGTYIDYVAKEDESFKFSPEEIIGSTIFEVGYSKKMVKQVYKSIHTVINHDAIETIEYVLEVVGKGSCFFEMRMVKLSQDSVMAISRDITKQKIAQQKIEEARKKAEEADQLKSAFLQNISHEVRTPLNAILGFSNVLLMDEEVPENEKRSYLQLIIRNGQILLHVFNDTIKLSRIQSGLMTVDKKFIYLNNTMTDLYRQFLFEKEQIGKNHLKLILTKGNENTKFSVCVDGQKIKDILESLLDNAVKFTQEGEVHFGYSLIEGGFLEFFVRDTGIGIPEEKFQEIFERFHQLDSSMTREYGGTGIGLSLARDFANLMGTKVEVQSVLGKGSRFSFVLPLEAGEGHLRLV